MASSASSSGDALPMPSSASSSSAALPKIRFAAIISDRGAMLVKATPGDDRIWQWEAAQIVEKVGDPREEFSVVCMSNQQHAFHFTSDASSSARFVCGADKVMGRRLPYAFLQAFMSSFGRRFTPPEIAEACTDGFQAVFGGEVLALMEEYNSPDKDRATALTAKVQHIQEELIESLDKLVERQEKIDVLVHRSGLLAEESTSFRRSAVLLERSTRKPCKRVLVGVTLAGILLLVVWLIAEYTSDSQ